MEPVKEQLLVLGPPTTRFRDNIRNDTKYITSWISAGWTNDVMTYGNLIYLGMITNRVPVIPPFTSSGHIGFAQPVPFGDIFDILRLRKAVGPILEWRDIKDPESEEIEDIGCWNIWEAVQYEHKNPRHSHVPTWLNLDISYTRAPDWVKLLPGFGPDQHSTFWSLAPLAYPEARNASLGNILPSPIHKAKLDPDEHMLCYDFLYYVTLNKPWEWDTDYAPMWREVVKHFRWTSKMEDLARTSLRATFGLPEQETIPPFISVHVRHNDFLDWCGDVPREECFASLPVVARRVEEVRTELRERKGLAVDTVVMTSDEKDPEWWQDVKKLGWVPIDHAALRTVDMHGKWYPILIDAVIQSMGAGFVGTDRSTMSMLARRRVQDWHNGAVRDVKWGYLDADAH
ncbi:hypothetical protein PUNSTDRAFT_85524 [Punctularia strigosozonata HHB-11173 SS5]|uniref:uncharacterized protein n=1 Tax=Punctularia strigosozonata (strain HHB-11173) TaxID=741275 RepID=UPI00044179BB|nr:uncharacterized protein PUNSTDRAFT_85524 [Punctularia strigosozonata HHB-11173 SS5]EIN11023.1 hypothetical protein PUNSTDRAFT_85524 [Punctularia strigosozonata HHB-11173 SS5]